MQTLKSIFATLGILTTLACGGSKKPGDPPSDPEETDHLCDLAGTWTVDAADGTTTTYEARTDGTSLLTLGGARTVTGTWSQAGDTLDLGDTGATGVAIDQRCSAGVTGQYVLEFEASCRAVMLTLVDDACPMRAAVVDGITMTR